MLLNQAQRRPVPCRFNPQFNQLHNLNRLACGYRVFSAAVERIANRRIISGIGPGQRQPGFLDALFAFNAGQYAVAHIVAPILLRQSLAAFQSLFLRIETVFYIASS